MNLQVICSGDGWVLDKYAHILADGCGGVVRTEPEAMPDGITYLMNYAQWAKLDESDLPRYGRIVSMFTHREEREPLCDLWLEATINSDRMVAMSCKTEEQVTCGGDAGGLCCAHTTVIPLPVRDCFTKRRPRIGIAACRNPGNEHRKGWDLVDLLRAEHPEWEIVTTGGELDDAALVDWYRSLDLYLCPSRYEGGPMGVVEAVASGVPVVAPKDAGWCNAYTQEPLRFAAGDYRDMSNRVALAVQWYANKAAGQTTEAEYIAAHRDLFASLLPF